jgi:hypothetical protein
VTSLLLMWIPIWHAWPWSFSPGARLLSFFPLVLCIAIVYRATRVRHVEELPKGVVITFLNMVLFMGGITVGLYLLYGFLLRTN